MAFVEYVKIPILETTTINDININEFKTNTTIVKTVNINSNNNNGAAIDMTAFNNYIECDGNGMKSVHIINDEIIHTTGIELQNVYQQKKKYIKIVI